MDNIIKVGATANAINDNNRYLEYASELVNRLDPNIDNTFFTYMIG